jgi:hypothetical protein
MEYIITTKATMKQKYLIEAETQEEAEKIALENTEDIIEQTQVDDGEILLVE